MSESLSILLFIVIFSLVTVFLSKRFKLSQRYERKPRELSQWNSLDKGIDPTDERS